MSRFLFSLFGNVWQHHMGRTVAPKGWRRAGRSSRYMPHQGEQEIARRLRQAAMA